MATIISRKKPYNMTNSKDLSLNLNNYRPLIPSCIKLNIFMHTIVQRMYNFFNHSLCKYYRDLYITNLLKHRIINGRQTHP